MQFQSPVTWKRWNESFLSTHIYAESLSLRHIFIFSVIPPTAGSKHNSAYSILFMFYCVKIHREKHSLGDRGLLFTEILSSLRRAEVLNSDYINKSVYSRYLHYIYTRLSSELGLCFYGIF